MSEAANKKDRKGLNERWDINMMPITSVTITTWWQSVTIWNSCVLFILTFKIYLVAKKSGRGFEPFLLLSSLHAKLQTSKSGTLSNNCSRTAKRVELTCTSSCNSRFTFSRPPMSSQVTLGTSTTVSRRALGLLLLIAYCIVKKDCIRMWTGINTEVHSQPRWQSTHPKVLHCHSQRTEHLCIYLIILQINQIHFLSDLLQSRLRTQGSQVSTNMAMSLGCNLKEESSNPS